MTTRPSYVFHTTSYTGVAHSGMKLVRVVVKDDKLSIYEKELVRTKNPKVLAEKVISKQVLSVHENSHGQKYLKLRKKLANGKMKDMPLTANFNVGRIARGLNDLTGKTVSNWFSDTIADWDKYNSLTTAELIRTLSFPFLRDPKCRWRDYTFGLSMMFADLQAIGHPVVNVLRESATWEEVLRTLCLTSITTEEDFRLLDHDVCALMPLASLPLADSLTSLKEKYGAQALSKFGKVFSLYDQTIIRFILQNSSPEERANVVHTLMALIDIHKDMSWEADSDSTHRRSEAAQYARMETTIANRLEFANVPHALWSNFSAFLREHLSSFYQVSAKMPEAMFELRGKQIEPNLKSALHHWYAENVFAPKMKTTRTVEEFEARFFELFNSQPWETHDPYACKAEWIETSDGLKFCFLPEKVSPEILDFAMEDADLLLLLDPFIANKYRPSKDRTGAQWNAYIENDRLHWVVGREAYSIEELTSYAEVGAAAIDIKLTRLGRPATPENRRAYLRSNPRMRDSRATWKYYDWGVTDPERIWSLIAAGVKNKADVQMYNALPDEMFQELLLTAMGVKTSPLTDEMDESDDYVF